MLMRVCAAEPRPVESSGEATGGRPAGGGRGPPKSAGEYPFRRTRIHQTDFWVYCTVYCKVYALRMSAVHERVMTVRVSETDLELWKSAAEIRRTSLSDWVRGVLSATAESTKAKAASSPFQPVAKEDA